MSTEAPNNLISTQTLRVIDLLCEGPISGFINKGGNFGSDPLCAVYYDDTPVRNPDGSYNFNVSGQGFSFQYALGTVSQTGIPGFQKIENVLPLSANTRIANPPIGGGPYKDVTASFTTNTFPDADSVKIAIRIPALLSQDKDGNLNPYRITWAVDIATNGGAFVSQPIPAGQTQSYSDTIIGKCTQPYVKNVTLPLPKPGGVSFYEWKIRVKRVSPNILTLKTQNEIYVDSISVISTTNFAYPNSAIVATEISADQFGNVPSRSYEIAGAKIKVPAGYTPTQYSYQITPFSRNCDYGNGNAFTRFCDYDINNKLIGFVTQNASQVIGLQTGMSIAGPSIPEGARIVSISQGPPEEWYFAIDVDPTETERNKEITFTPNPENKVIVFSNQVQSQVIGVTPGMSVAGLGIPAGAKVTSVNSSAPWSFSINIAPTSAQTNSAITFTPDVGSKTVTAAVYPAVWDGTFQDQVWTDNPAWIFYDLMTNPIRGLGDYITSNYVDKWSLYDIARYCDTLVDDGKGGFEPQFTCNVQIQQPEEAYSVMLNLASTFRGMLYYANGTINAVQTRQNPPVFSFTNANVIDGSFNYADSARNTRATVAVVKWIDPDNGYRENVEYVEDVEGILKYGYNEKQMTAFACTSRGQAYRLGKWTLETERLQTETVTFQTDLEGTYLRPGDNFAIYDNFRNNRNQGGRIVGFDSSRNVVTLDRPVEIQSGPVYTLAAITPQLALMGTGDITGSSQIDLIRNSQIETYKVITSPVSSTSSLTIQGQFSTGLYVGSPFILSVSGSTGIFDQASFYTCLATAEAEPGKIEILGVKAPTGVYFRLNEEVEVPSYKFARSDWPDNPGDSSSISAPSNLFVTGITGILSDSTIYTDLKLTWTDSPSNNLAQYIISGKAPNELYTTYTTRNNGTLGWTYERVRTGLYSFRLAAQSIGGKYSSFIQKDYLVERLNPFASLSTMSGIEIIEDYDPLYRNNQGKYTGYIGTTPTFSWNITGGVTSQFISGYRFSIRDFADTTNYITPVELDGVDNTSYKLPTGTIYNFAGGAKRGFKVKVDIKDIDGNYSTGSQLNVNNPPMKPPFSSGFVGYNNGISYNVTPSVQYDTSGIYLWVDQSPLYSPSYSNYDFQSSNLAGNVNIAPSTGSFYTWFALGDTFGSLDNPIYGPVSGNANQLFGDLFIDISQDVNDAFSYLSGEITQLQKVVTGVSGNLYVLVQGLSGSFTGLSGAISQGLNVQLQSVFASSGFVTSTQLNAVSASISGGLGQSIGATGTTLLQAVAATGGANVRYTVDIAAATTGQNAAVQIAARAMVTGSVNGQGGAALATWGFKLNANGKAASLQATATNFTGNFNGDLTLGNMNIKSDTYSPGSAGWQIGYDGNAEFNNIRARGAFSGGTSSATTYMDGSKFVLGDINGSRIETTTASAGNILSWYTVGGFDMIQLGTATIVGTNFGTLTLREGTAAGTTKASLTSYNNGSLTLGGASPTISLAGSNGSINCDILTVDTTSTFTSTATFNGTTTQNSQFNVLSNNKIHFSAAGTNVSYIAEDWGVNIWGDNTHPIKIRGGALVRGSSAGASYAAGNIYGFGIPFNSSATTANQFEADTVAGSDVSFGNYLRIKGPAGVTIYIPYTSTAP